MELSTTTHPENVIPVVATEADESPTLAALAAALAKAQGQMKAAAKDADNKHFGSRYADLASIWEACREPLSANGLAVLQPVSTTDEGVVLTTILIHSSGEFIRTRALFPIAQRTPHAIGSAITYARRYALASLVGVAPAEDDDGNAAAKAAPQEQRRPERKPERREAAPTKTMKERAKVLWEAAKKRGATQETFGTWVESVLGAAKPSKEWTDEDIDGLWKAFKADRKASTGGAA